MFDCAEFHQVCNSVLVAWHQRVMDHAVKKAVG